MAFKQTKLYNWEYWPYWIFYFPIYLQVIWYALRTGTLAFFSAANPVMEMGGFVNYSKYNVLQYLPKELKPKSMFFKAGVANVDYEQQIKAHFDFPLILKPDRGERGFGVRIVSTTEALQKVLNDYSFDFIVQEFIEAPIELGVMYWRMPGNEKGTINSIVRKDFLTIYGNGTQTVHELLVAHPRGKYYIDHIKKFYAEKLEEIPKSNEPFVLEPIGNHSRGTTFINASDLITEELTTVFDKISKHIPGFYFGRFDLRVPSIEDLYQGNNIKILEINGANSEPAHIYDPNMPLIKAYRHLIDHWRNLFMVSRANHRKGVPYMSTWKGYLHLQKHLRQKSAFQVSE